MKVEMMMMKVERMKMWMTLLLVELKRRFGVWLVLSCRNQDYSVHESRNNAVAHSASHA